MKALSARYQKGFTLVELVIVIALLAALALGVLAALDPLEQIRKGQDTAKRDVATQFYTASVRYYAQKEYMPWCTDASNCPGMPLSGTLSSTFGSSITKLTTQGELKSSFNSAYSAQLPLVYGNATANSISVCYLPQSKQFQSDANSKYTSAGAATCTAGIGSGCYWCAL